MAQDDSATHKCWIGLCPECSGCVAVYVAPTDESSTSDLAHALAARRDWERRGCTTAYCTVGEIRTGTMPFRHNDGCSRDKRSKRRQQAEAITALPFSS